MRGGHGAATVTFEESIRASLAAWFDVLAERGGGHRGPAQRPALAGDLGERRRELRAVIGDFYAAPGAPTPSGSSRELARIGHHDPAGRHRRA